MECTIAAGLARGGTRGRTALHCALLNLATHPTAWLVVQRGISSWAAAEVAVTAVEALGYRGVTRLSRARALAVSCACNAATAALALMGG